MRVSRLLPFAHRHCLVLAEESSPPWPACHSSPPIVPVTRHKQTSQYNAFIPCHHTFRAFTTFE